MSDQTPDAPIVALVPAETGSEAWLQRVRRGTDAALIRAGRSTKLLRNGVYSTDHVKEEILSELETLYARVPHLDPVVHGPVVESLARMIVRMRRIDELLDGPGATRDVLALASRLEGQIRLTSAELGMTPKSQAALGLAALDGRAKARAEAEKALTRYASKPKRSTRR